MDDSKRMKDGGGTATRPVRRPMNAFLIFCKRHRSLVREKNPQLDNRSVTRILGELWAKLPTDDKAQYISSAKQYKEEFMKVNPNYKWYNPEKHNAANAAKPATRPSNAFIVYHGEKPHTLDTGITPGKLADPSCMGGLSLLLMAGEQTLHTQGHNSQSPGHNSQSTGHDAQSTGHDVQSTGHNSQSTGHDVQNPGTDSQISGSESQTAGHDAQVQGRDTGVKLSVGKKPKASDEAASHGDNEKRNTALLQLAEMCTSRLNDNRKEGVSEDTSQPSATHPYGGPAVKSPTPAPLWAPLNGGPPPPAHPPPPMSKDSPMDLSNKKHEPVNRQQVLCNTWFGAAVEHPQVDSSRVSEALDLTVPSKPTFTELNIPCRKPVATDQPKLLDGKPMSPPGGSMEKQSRQGGSSKSVATCSGQNFTISGQNLVDKVLESLYYHMNTQKVTEDDTKTCSFRSRGTLTKRKDTQHKNTPTVHQNVTDPIQCDSGESRKRNMSVRKQYARTPDGGSMKSEYDIDNISTALATFKVIEPSMTFGEIQETLIRRAVEAPGSLLSDNVRRFSTGSASRAVAVARSRASACRRTASTSDTLCTQNAPANTSCNVEMDDKEGLSGCDESQAKETSRVVDGTQRKLVSDAAGNLLSWQQPLPLDSDQKVDSGKERKIAQHRRNGSPLQEEAGAKEESGTDTVQDIMCQADDNGLDTPSACETKDIFTFHDDSTENEGDVKPSDGLVTGGRCDSAASSTHATTGTREVLSTRKKFSAKLPQDLAEPARWKTQSRRREPKREAKNVLKDTIKDELNGERREDHGKPLKKRRLKVDEKKIEELDHKLTTCDYKLTKAKRGRKNKSVMTSRPSLESNDSSNSSSPVQSEDNPQQSPPEGADSGSGGVRKSQRSNRGKKYQELISQGLIQPSRNGSRRQESSDDHHAKVDGDFLPVASGIVGSRRSRKRTLSEASASHDDTTRRTYKTGSFDLDARIATLPVCDLVFAKKSTKPAGVATCLTAKSSLSETKEGTDLNIVEVRRLTKQQTQNEAEIETRLSGSQRRKARKFSITHLLECRSSTAASATPAGGVTNPSTPSLKSPDYLENNNNNSSQVAQPFPNVIVPVTATIATCSIGLGLLQDVAGTKEHQSLPAGDAMTTSSTNTAIVVT